MRSREASSLERANDVVFALNTTRSGAAVEKM